MKKILTTAVLVVLAGVGAYAYWGRDKPSDRAAVTQAAIQQGAIAQIVQATGTLEAVRTVQVGAQVSGTVSELGADFNSIVRKNQVIARLDPSLLNIQVDVQKASIERQQSDIDMAKVQLDNDRVNAARAQAQFDKGLLSQQQLETAQLQVKNREASINSLEKQLVQAQANLHQAELNVSYTTIRSHIDGVVVDRKVDIGQTVQSSMTTPQFFTIATDLSVLKLTAGVDEADIGYIRPNMPVTFTVDAYGTQPFHGSVDSVRLNAQTQNNVVTYPVWITVQNADLKLRPSMTANLKIVVDQATDVLKIPNQALRFRPTADTYTWLGMKPVAAAPRGRTAVADAGAAGPTAGKPITAADERKADKIDELFQPLTRRAQTGQVWIYDDQATDASRKLRPITVQVGLTDGQFTELVSAAEPIAASAKVVTGIVPPASVLAKTTTTPAAGNIFNQNQRGGPGGFGPPPGGFGGGRN